MLSNWFNVKLEYLYRDGANYKQYGYVVFSQAHQNDIDVLCENVRDALIQGEYFVPDLAGLPNLYFDIYDPFLDHDWHEFIGLSFTTDEPTDARTIETFVLEFALQAEHVRN